MRYPLFILIVFSLSAFAVNASEDEDKLSETPAELGFNKKGKPVEVVDLGPEQKPLASPAPVTPPAASLPKAKSVDLGEPVPVVDTSEAVPTEPQPAPITAPAPPETTAAETTPPFVLLNTAVEPGTSTRLLWSLSKSYDGIAAPTPILIVNGASPGPTLCLTAAIHGDELNGIEIVRRVLYNIDAQALSGTVIGVPIVNLQGFHRGSRYLSDRRDLNRFFPGNTTGSSAARIAYSFFKEIISHCDALVDLHTGSFYRTNLPQLRADVSKENVVKLTQGFGATVILHSKGAIGTLRAAAVAAGIPAVTLEAGEPMRLDEDAVAHGVKGVRTLLNQMGMVKKISLWGEPEPVYHNSIWIRVNQGGILFSQVELGERVSEGDLLGTVTDPITNVRSDISSSFDGRIIGMALNQVVMPGFAAFHIATHAEEMPSASTSPPEQTLPADPESPTVLLEDDLEVN